MTEDEGSDSLDSADDEGGRGSDFNARLMVLWSSPILRFAFRAAITIAIVILVAIVAAEH